MFYYTPYIILPLLSAVVCGALAVFAYRRRRLPLAVPVFCSMSILSVWSFSYALNTAATSLSGKILFYKIATTFVAFIGVPGLVIAAGLLGYGNLINRRRVVMLAVIPAIGVFLAWTGEHHTLFRHSFFLFESGPLRLLGFKLGPAWFFYISYMNVLNVATAVLFLLGILRGPAGSRPRFLLLFIGTMVPLLVDSLNLTPFKGFAMVTSSLWFTGSCYTMAVFRYRLLEVAPVARTTLFDQLGDPVLVFDLGGTLIDFNKAARELLCPGTNVGLVNVHASALARFPALKSLSDNVPVDINNYLNDAVEVSRFWEIKSMPLTRGEERVGNMVQLHDTTGLKQSEDGLRRAREAAESANRAKSAFFANISHEIRTPMNAIIGMTDLVLDSGLSSRDREHLETVKGSAESLLSILNAVLDLSKIEAGKLELDEADFDLGRLLEETIKTLSPKAVEKGLKLELKKGGNVPDWVRGDPTKLKQVLINLLGNALKFTEKGGISLEVEKLNADGGDGQKIMLSFSVKDTGIGIAQDKMEGIFEPFTQADGSITRRYGGTGLGLSISKEFVRMMGGKLRVESEAGKGSVFSFTASFSPGVIAEQTDQKESLPPSLLRRLRVLVVEDIATNRALAKNLLEKRGHIVTEADNGRDAINVLERKAFDIVLMDVQMPEMDGFEAAKIIRDPGSSVLRHDVPIVALTAHVMKGDCERCLEAGMDGYISKPINSERFAATVERFAVADWAPVLGASMAEGQAPPPVREMLAAKYFGDVELADELWRAFSEESPRLLEGMEDAVKNDDLGRLRMDAHAFKSAAGTVGAGSMQEMAYNIEEAAKSGDMEKASIYFRELEAELRRYLK